MQSYQNYNSVKVKLRKLKPSERPIRSWKINLKKPQRSWLQHKRSSKLMIKQQRELLQLCKRKWHSELIRWASYYEFCTREMRRKMGRVSSCSHLWDCFWGQYTGTCSFSSPVMFPQASTRYDLPQASYL